MFKHLLRLAMLVLVSLGVGRLSAQERDEPSVKGLTTAKVVVMDLQPKIVERGLLEARNNAVVFSEVRTGYRGAPTIKRIVDSGTAVKGPVFAKSKLFGLFPIVIRQGDLLAEIDDPTSKTSWLISKSPVTWRNWTPYSTKPNSRQRKLMASCASETSSLANSTWRRPSPN